MPVESTVVAKHEFVEICIEVLAAQTMICAEAPSLHQRKSPMNPRQDNVGRHLADDAWIVPIARQARIGSVAIGEQRGSALHVGLHESFDRRCGIVGDHGEADTARTCIEIFGGLASWFGPIGIALDHLDSSDHEYFASNYGLEECIAFAEWNFRLIDFDDSFQ